MKSIFRAAICILMLGFVSACVIVQKYPSDWAPRATSINDIEEEIVGEFSCYGKGGYCPLLGYFSFNSLKKCDTLRFRQIKVGELEITAILEIRAIIAGLSYEPITSETITLIDGEDYSKVNGWLVFPRGWAGGEFVQVPIVGASKGSNSFTLTESGDLIVKDSGGAVGVIALIPMAGYGSTWCKFDRLSDE